MQEVVELWPLPDSPLFSSGTTSVERFSLIRHTPAPERPRGLFFPLCHQGTPHIVMVRERKRQRVKNTQQHLCMCENDQCLFLIWVCVCVCVCVCVFVRKGRVSKQPEQSIAAESSVFFVYTRNVSLYKYFGAVRCQSASPYRTYEILPVLSV